jgi:transposase
VFRFPVKMKHSAYHLAVVPPPSIARRRKRAAALRDSGLSTRAIAGRLGVSQPTAVRDLRAHDEAEAEAVIAALAGRKLPAAKRARRPDPWQVKQIKAKRWKRRDELGGVLDANWQRRLWAEKLRGDGLSLRQIAGRLGVSPATVLRDLRRE